MTRLYSIFLFLILNISFISPSLGWELIKDKNGVQVYKTQLKPWKKNSFKGETIVNGTLNNVLSFMNDVNNYRNWMWMSHDTKRLKTFYQDDFIAYGVQQIPFSKGMPIKDREFIVRVKIKQNKKDYSIVAELKAIPDYLPTNSKFVRIRDLGAKWHFYPIAKNKVKVVYEGHANPGGMLAKTAPKGLTNMIINNMPYYSLKKLRTYDLSKYNIKTDLFVFPPDDFFNSKR
jgi:hypothetical protein